MMSSANSEVFVCQKDIIGMSLMKIVKSSGLRHAPCGHPQLMVIDIVVNEFILTLKDLFARNSFMNSMRYSGTFSLCILKIKASCHILSKAFSRSKRMHSVFCPLLKPSVVFCTKLNRLSRVCLPVRKPDCSCMMIFCSFRNVFRRLSTSMMPACLFLHLFWRSF